MPLHVLGISHLSAPLEVREQLDFAPERQDDALIAIAAEPGVAEAVLVSTCNRTEVDCRCEDAGTVRAWLEAEAAKSGLALEGHLYVHSEEAAVRHAFRVACGLDSMALGEPQILGQAEQSVRTAEGIGSSRHRLASPSHKAFTAAKQVRPAAA